MKSFIQNISFFLLVFMGSIALQAQERDITKRVFKQTIEDGDTLVVMNLEPVQVFSPRTFKNKREERQYGRLKRYVVKVYPYAKIAGEMLKEFDDTLNTFKSDLKKKVYMKKAEKRLQAEFEGELKKLTIKQGIILVKLIDRETGNTSYELVKQLRGSFSAFLWQSMARLFGSNLKLKYDPYGEDKLIEEIVVMIEQGMIPCEGRVQKYNLQ